MFGTGSAQDEYFWLVGKVVGQFAQVEQCLNDVLAGEQGLFRDEATAYAAGHLADRRLSWKVGQAARLAGAHMPEGDPTIEFMRRRAPRLVDLRNDIAHGYVLTVEPFPVSTRGVTLSVGLGAHGTPVERQITVADVEALSEEAVDFLVHTVCLWTHMPDAPASPRRFSEVE